MRGALGSRWFLRLAAADSIRAQVMPTSTMLISTLIRASIYCLAAHDRCNPKSTAFVFRIWTADFRMIPPDFALSEILERAHIAVELFFVPGSEFQLIGGCRLSLQI